MKNQYSLYTLCAALAYTMGINAPQYAEQPSAELCSYVDKAFKGKKADRIFMYNPDAIAEWICKKYPYLLKEATNRTELAVPFCTVMPSLKDKTYNSYRDIVFNHLIPKIGDYSN